MQQAHHSETWPLATMQQRQRILNRVKLNDAVATVVAALAYPVDQDRAERRPPLRLLGMPEAQ